MTNREPLSVRYGIGCQEHDQEGRVITLEYDNYYVVTVYTPNAGEELRRLDYRIAWDKAFGAFVAALDKPVLLCGDLNVANTNLDVYDPLTLAGSTGFTNEERLGFRRHLLSQLTDAYRLVHPKERKYSWWSYFDRARGKGLGLAHRLLACFAFAGKQGGGSRDFGRRWRQRPLSGAAGHRLKRLNRKSTGFRRLSVSFFLSEDQ